MFTFGIPEPVQALNDQLFRGPMFLGRERKVRPIFYWSARACIGEIRAAR